MMPRIKIAYHLLLLTFTGLILLASGLLVFNAYASHSDAKILSRKITGLLEYVSVKQVDKNSAQDLEKFLSDSQNSTTTLKINSNPFKIFSQEEESPEVIISPTTNLEQLP